jgi:acetyltransferase-like isoleucine patch superfamily enzyme
MAFLSINRLKLLYRRMSMAYYLRTRYRFRSVGKNPYIHPSSHILANKIEAGDYLFLGRDCFVTSQAKMGNFVMIASDVAIVGGDHNMEAPGLPMIFSGREVNHPVIIDDDVWIGRGVIILHGVHVGEGAVIAAGAVVSRDVEPYTVVAGVPAKALRSRFTNPADEATHRAALEQYRQTKQWQPGWRYADRP